jgi:hypothetical protein
VPSSYFEYYRNRFQCQGISLPALLADRAPCISLGTPGQGDFNRERSETDLRSTAWLEDAADWNFGQSGTGFFVNRAVR